MSYQPNRVTTCEERPADVSVQACVCSNDPRDAEMCLTVSPSDVQGTAVVQFQSVNRRSAAH